MTYELYPAFEHWMPKNGNIWFYSDPHFGDEESWLLRKQFVHDVDNVEAFDNLQIATINKTCAKNDTLVILGDVGNIEYIRKLKAKKKILILGNHDQGATNYKRQIVTDQYHIFNTNRCSGRCADNNVFIICNQKHKTDFFQFRLQKTFYKTCAFVFCRRNCFVSTQYFCG